MEEDGRLVMLARDGSTAAYDELFHRHRHSIHSIAKRVVHDYHLAEEISQEAFAKAFWSLAALSDPNKFGQWMRSIVLRKALDYKRFAPKNPSLDSLLDQGFEPSADFDESVDPDEAERVLEVLGDLREDYLEIVVMKHVKGLSYKEMSRRLGMSVSAVGEKLSRVRSMVRQRMERRPIC